MSSLLGSKPQKPERAGSSAQVPGTQLVSHLPVSRSRGEGPRGELGSKEQPQEAPRRGGSHTRAVWQPRQHSKGAKELSVSAPLRGGQTVRGTKLHQSRRLSTTGDQDSLARCWQPPGGQGCSSDALQPKPSGICSETAHRVQDLTPDNLTQAAQSHANSIKSIVQKLHLPETSLYRPHLPFPSVDQQHLRQLHGADCFRTHCSTWQALNNGGKTANGEKKRKSCLF